MQISRVRFIALYTLMCLIWGSTWLVIHIGINAGLPPFTGAALRFLLTAIIMTAWAIGSKAPAPASPKEWRAVILVGLLSNGLSFALVYGTSKYVPSGLAAVIFGTMPLWTAIFAHLYIENDRMTATKVTGILLGIVGIGFIFYPEIALSSNANLAAMFLLLLSPIASGASAIVTKKHTHHVSPIVLNGVTTWVGAVVLGGIALLKEDPLAMTYTTTHMLTVAYLSIFGTAISFVTYFRLIKISSAVTMSYIALITPVIAMLLGWLILGETLGFNDFAGAGLVLGGVLFSLRP
jgi:drug/metabolite transporter (DMT)-like permease